MILTTVAAYHVTLDMTAAERQALFFARATRHHNDTWLDQVRKAARKPLGLRAAKILWHEDVNRIAAYAADTTVVFPSDDQPLYFQATVPEAVLLLALVRSFDLAATHTARPDRTPRWGSEDGLRTLLAALCARWEAAITTVRQAQQAEPAMPVLADVGLAA